jgi:predicted DNA-binding transcriptional regulator YafY
LSFELVWFLGTSRYPAKEAGLLISSHLCRPKVDAVLPPRLRPRLSSVELFAPLDLPAAVRAHLECFRRGIEQKRKLRFGYDDERGARTDRTVRPVCLAFWGNAWTASAWCEIRGDFRTFRPDRMRDVELLEEQFIDEPDKGLPAFLATVRHG